MNDKLREKMAKLAGLCWHDWQPDPDEDYFGVGLKCVKCGETDYTIDIEGRSIECVGPTQINFTESLDACIEYLVPDVIVGIYFRYFPGGCECEIIYITEAGFDTEKSWVENKTGNENKSKELSALALCLAIEKLIDGEK